MPRTGPPQDDTPMTPESSFGRRIAQLRDAAGLTQRELARRMGLTQSALSRIESGSRRLSAAQALQLSQILSVDPGLLLSIETDAQAASGSPERADWQRSESWSSHADQRPGYLAPDVPESADFLLERDTAPAVDELRGDRGLAWSPAPPISDADAGPEAGAGMPPRSARSESRAGDGRKANLLCRSRRL